MTVSQWLNQAFPIYLIHPMPTKGFPLDEMRDDYRIAEDRIRVAVRVAAE